MFITFISKKALNNFNVYLPKLKRFNLLPKCIFEHKKIEHKISIHSLLYSKLKIIHPHLNLFMIIIIFKLLEILDIENK